ncbi:hypothetical protein H072_6935 [Dactylellina haptotyla CBS 200.50]|uniref:F-box domain-containing protein n=1 Tax=Dactylellina haptotyla (strain CBS 200.50) TaxID=1284197 RepID=S8A8F5_DACHA|nr:hypothetical protein H072_6935 [Dactylellina haptotyla CBS 200.50]
MSTNTTIPLPTELILEVLGYGGRDDVYHFAQTSKTSYELSVQLLYKRIDLIVAIKTGALDRHEKYNVYDCVRAIDLPVGFHSPEFWTETENAEAVVVAHLRKFQHLEEVHVISAEEAYSSDCPSYAVLSFILKELMYKISTLFLEFYTFQRNKESVEIMLEDLRSHLRDYFEEIEEAQDNYPPCENFKNLKIWVTGPSPRIIMRGVNFLLARYVRNLETIEFSCRWNLEMGLEDDWGWNYLPPIGSTTTKRLVLEDKTDVHVRRLCRRIWKRWPNLVELELDCGPTTPLHLYAQLFHLNDLRKLHIAFPYVEWGEVQRETMSEEAEYAVGFFADSPLTLNEVGVKYMNQDGTLSQTAIFGLIHVGGDNDKTPAQTQLIGPELWQGKGDFLDVHALKKVISYQSDESSLLRRISRYIQVDELSLDKFGIVHTDS